MIADLDGYLRRIRFEGRARTDRATLQQLALRHPLAIAFENLDAFTGRAVSLDPLEVEDKLLRRRRGGWCFEHNLLLGNALRSIGFEVQDLAARVLWGRDDLERTARTHRLLQVRCEGRRWLMDAGFGVLTPTAPLNLDSGAEQKTPHELFRLRPLDGDLLLEAAADIETPERTWMPLYRFDLQPQWPMDFEAANFQLALDPASRFVTSLAVARPTAQGRYTLRGRELTFWNRSVRSEVRTLGDAAALLQALEQVFDIDTSAVSGLAERFNACALTGADQAGRAQAVRS